MPFPLFKRSPEDAPDGDPASHLAPEAELRTHALTQELLDWSLAALEATIHTPQFKDAPKRVQTAILDGYKYLDWLYPYRVEVPRAEPVPASAVVPERAGADDGPHDTGGPL